MAFIILAYKGRQVLVARPQSLSQLQSTVLEIFGTDGKNLRLSIVYADPKGTRSLVELHTSSYNIVKDGDMIFLANAKAIANKPANTGTQQAVPSTSTEQPAGDVQMTTKITTRESLLEIAPEDRHLHVDFAEFLRHNRGNYGNTKEAHQEPFYYKGMPGYD
ncbi:hypothetical protein B0H65DRAFT_173327 [Neurospora tetraspora]|uniref:Uncharacterized protein n=1 Tax=Neurospora tetraspora TaxID=94610 RepID=A0AAE0JIZ1_9PEZI|nr:hypothetical protein B0H65DRAFT_173327 [Neurospora tetraspora]